MGRSNGCEANRKRADAAKRAEKYNKDGKGQNEINAAAMSIVCQKCFQQFMCTQRKAAEQHAETKHPKDSLDDCFPNLEAMCAAGSGAAKATKDKRDKEKSSKRCAK